MGKPAARIGDMHMCPLVTGMVPHVGGPVLPPGEPTVLIGGMPAARMGDMAMCVGPLDIIASGSATVFIGGKPAARVGDTTAHGGSIVAGCQTVLLSEDTATTKRQRLQMRLNLIAYAREKAKGMQEPQRTEVSKAADRLGANNTAVELAKLSEDAYNHYSQDAAVPPEGWTPVSDTILLQKGIDLNLLKDSKAVIYQTPDDWPGGKKTVLAFRGTSAVEDGVVDYDQALGLSTRQYEAAKQLGSDVGEILGEDVVVTGHSLGGGKAQAAGTAGGLKGTMFNSAGLNPDTVGGIKPASDQFVQYRTSGDPLTGVQNSPGAQVVVTALAGYIAMPVGTGIKRGDGIVKLLGFSGLSEGMARYADMAFKAFPRAIKNLLSHGCVLPPAVGQVHEVSAVDESGRSISLCDPMGQHSINSVINGIEQQKQQDIKIL